MCLYSHIIKNVNESLTTLVFPEMYVNQLMGYEILKHSEDLDDALEYDESDILEHYKFFYDDVCSEMKKFGRLKQFLVCSNYEPHLRGNVYVQYEKYKIYIFIVSSIFLLKL